VGYLRELGFLEMMKNEKSPTMPKSQISEIKAIAFIYEKAHGVACICESF
jgi:hypothetical protein